MKYCVFKEHWSRFPSTEMGGKKNLKAWTKAVLLEFNIKVFFLANATMSFGWSFEFAAPYY